MAYLGLDGQVEGTFFKGQQVPIVVAGSLWVDPHFELPAERRKLLRLPSPCLATPERELDCPPPPKPTLPCCAYTHIVLDHEVTQVGH